MLLKPEAHAACAADGGHCPTCADEAIEATVLQFDSASGMALVMLGDAAAEIDATLVDDPAPGDVLLVHGGVAIAKL